MEEIEVDWKALPEAPFASLEEMPRAGDNFQNSAQRASPTGGTNDSTGGGDGAGWLADEDEDEDDVEGALLSATEAFAVDECATCSQSSLFASCRELLLICGA